MSQSCSTDDACDSCSSPSSLWYHNGPLFTTFLIIVHCMILHHYSVCHCPIYSEFPSPAKPHGHGDVHSLMYSTGTAAAWRSSGVKWVLFFQDTNSLAFITLPAMLGVSVGRYNHQYFRYPLFIYFPLTSSLNTPTQHSFSTTYPFVIPSRHNPHTFSTFHNHVPNHHISTINPLITLFQSTR